MSLPVFLVSPAEIKNLTPNQEYRLSGREGHHAAVVQRRAAGEEIEIVDGVGRRLRATITENMGRALALQVTSVCDEPRSHPQITIVQGLIKGGGTEAIAGMTEAGVDVITPWQSQRAIAKWQGAKAPKARDRWKTTAQEASKQSRRSYVPQVRDVVQNNELTAKIRRASAEGTLVLMAHEHAEVSKSLRDVPELTDAAAVWCIIGPEGGISSSEAAMFIDAGAIPVRLGAHIFRSTTAGTVATALLRAFTADHET